LVAIAVTDLGKSFGGTPACAHLTFEVERGEVFGLLGPNGAGKTTTLRMLAGLYAPDAGKARVAGFEIAPGKPGGPLLRQRVGLLTEHPGFYDRLTARENLLFFGRLQGRADVAVRADKLLDRFALAAHAKKPFAALSRGMKQKLAIARALLHGPEVVFLDEPTVGLDPEATREVRALIAELAAEHTTIVLCTHHLDEVERLCSRAAFIATRLLAVHDVKRQEVIKVELARPFDPAPVAPLCRSIEVSGGTLYLEPAAEVPDIVAALVAAGARVVSVSPHKDPLESAWLDLLAAARESGLAA
jgi:ABC-2 type transport system ATP-binding protein